MLRGQDADDRADEEYIEVHGEKKTKQRDRAILNFKRSAEYTATRKLAGNTFPTRPRTPNPRDISMSKRQWETQVQRWKKITQQLDPTMRVHPWIGPCTFSEFTTWLVGGGRAAKRGYTEYHEYWKSLPLLCGQAHLEAPAGVNKGVRNVLWMRCWY